MKIKIFIEFPLLVFFGIFSERTHVKFTWVNEIEASYERLRI